MHFLIYFSFIELLVFVLKCTSTENLRCTESDQSCRQTKMLTFSGQTDDQMILDACHDVTVWLYLLCNVSIVMA